MATYLEQYHQHLEALISKGGTPKEMEACLEEYNRSGDPSWVATKSFNDWAGRMKFTCVDCRKTYAVANPSPDNETRCEKCKCDATTSPI